MWNSVSQFYSLPAPQIYILSIERARNSRRIFGNHVAVAGYANCARDGILQCSIRCGLSSHSCVIIPRELRASKNSPNGAITRSEMARPTGKCYRFRDEICERFTRCRFTSVQTAASHFTARSGCSWKKIEALAAFLLVRRAVGLNHLLPSLKRTNFSTFDSVSRPTIKNTRASDRARGAARE